MSRGLADPVFVHDQSLTRKVGRDSEAGDIVDQQLHLLGTQLVTHLNVLLKNARSHGGSNTALDRPVESIGTLVHTLGVDQPVSLRVQEGFVYLGDRHLRMTTHDAPIFASFVDALRSVGAGGLVLRPDAAADLRRFADIFVSILPGDEALERIRKRLAEAKIETVTLEAPRSVLKQDMPGEATARGPSRGLLTPVQTAAAALAKLQGRARGAYARAGTALNEVNARAAGRGTISFRQAKRAIQNIVDILLKDPSTVLGLTTLRSHDVYTQNHSVNVAVLSMALGNRVGYTKAELADVGLAALFHDLGKCAVPLAVLNKPGEFDAQDWEIMRTHPSEGVLKLFDSRGLTRVPARMAAASFEHHLNYDNQSGYPVLSRDWPQTLSSRVITIADCYDAMTSARVYRREPLPPPAVLRFMLGKAGTSFDPALLKHFVTCVGIIPIGTLVLLDTGELAVVVRPATERLLADRPVVRIIADASGTPLAPIDRDLRDTDADGVYARTIVRLVDNTEYRIDMARYVAAPVR